MIPDNSVVRMRGLGTRNVLFMIQRSWVSTKNGLNLLCIRIVLLSKSDLKQNVTIWGPKITGVNHVLVKTLKCSPSKRGQIFNINYILSTSWASGFALCMLCAPWYIMKRSCVVKPKVSAINGWTILWSKQMEMRVFNSQQKLDYKAPFLN